MRNSTWNWIGDTLKPTTGYEIHMAFCLFVCWLGTEVPAMSKGQLRPRTTLTGTAEGEEN